MSAADWTLAGSEGLPIRGSVHEPKGQPRAVALLAHGYKGYKDYGFLPVLAERLAVEAGLLVHRFNFSHSGMGEDIATFERLDLFERDTFNKQVHDIRAVAAGVGAGQIPGAGLAQAWIGHSRGGVSCLLAAGRAADEPETPTPDALVTLASPAATCSLDADAQRALLENGWMPERSARTGQDMRVGAAWLREQLDAPEAHDVPLQASRVRCPMLVVHGEQDPTAPVEHANRIAAAASARLVRIPGTDHVFNTPNPAPPSAMAGVIAPELCACVDAVVRFVGDSLRSG